MLLPNSSHVESQAAALIKSLAKGCSSCGSFSTVPYDSAWVSMIQNNGSDGYKQWRFLDCFEYILGTQNHQGSWQSGTSDVDTILNTLASVLTLKLHIAEPLNSTIPADIEERVLRAVNFLQEKFETWDVEASDHVGFEILVPNLLHLLEKEGFHFKLRDMLRLASLNEKKMEKFHPQMLYTDKKCTLLHSLEGLIGKIDFDKVTHHINSGSMMASPASTAAYLIYSTKWNEESEQYLETVLSSGSGKGNGGVPSAWPTPIFELSWTLSTLLVSGFTVDKLGCEDIKVISKFLKNSLEAGNGLLGFGRATTQAQY